MVFHWILSDRKSPQVSRTLFNILTDLNNAVVWMFFTRPVISNSSSPCTNLLVTVPRAPITIGINITFLFYSLFSSLARSMYLSLFLFSSNFTLWSVGSAKSTILQVLFFWLLIIRSGRLAEIRYLLVSQNPIGVCVTFSGTDVGFCLYHLFVWSDFSSWHNSQWITLPTHLCKVL